MTDLKALEERLVEACEKRRAEGWTIVPDWGTVATKTCCPISAIEPVNDLEEAADLIGASQTETLAFTLGFDGLFEREAGNQAPDYYNLGKRVSARVLGSES